MPDKGMGDMSAQNREPDYSFERKPGTTFRAFSSSYLILCDSFLSKIQVGQKNTLPTARHHWLAAMADDPHKGTGDAIQGAALRQKESA
ncbi:hypothetical protein [Parvularcula marina]|uniref:hypothetical protein n=1 Tax=Parvularcula marina TaxID=2292771 RepID=UPI0035593C1F